MERTSLNKWEISEIQAALLERHEAYLEDGEFFEIAGYRSKSEVHLTMTLRNEDETFVYPVDCRIDFSENENLKTTEGLELVLDFLDYYYSRYLREDRELLLPIDWGSFTFEECQIWARGQILNRKLEQLADQFLAGEISKEEFEKLQKNKI